MRRAVTLLETPGTKASAMTKVSKTFQPWLKKSLGLQPCATNLIASSTRKIDKKT